MEKLLLIPLAQLAGAAFLAMLWHMVLLERPLLDSLFALTSRRKKKSLTPLP
jgi:hypothetical protein